MAKRFIDSEIFKKPLLRSLKSPFKLLWVYLFCDCNNAGIWEYDPEVANIRIGQKIDWTEAEKLFADRIIKIDGGQRWFIPEFILYQYGVLQEKNPAHKGVIILLKKYNLINGNLEVLRSPFGVPTVGTQVMDMVKVMDKEMDNGKKVMENNQKSQHPLLMFIETLDNVSKLRDQLTESQADKLLNEFGEPRVKEILESMQNKKDLVKKYTSVYLTCKKWCRNDYSKNGKSDEHPAGDYHAGKPDYSSATL